MHSTHCSTAVLQHTLHLVEAWLISAGILILQAASTIHKLGTDTSLESRVQLIWPFPRLVFVFHQFSLAFSTGCMPIINFTTAT